MVNFVHRVCKRIKKWSILFLDGCASRNNRLKLISLFYLTHLMQWFGTSITRSLNQSLKRFVNDKLPVCITEQQIITSFLHLAQVIGIIDSVRASTLTTHCKIAIKCCGLFLRDQKQFLKIICHKKLTKK